MNIKYLATDWLQNKETLLNNMSGTYTECYTQFGEAVEADVETFEGVEFPAEATLVEDIVTDRMGSHMYSRLIEILGNDDAQLELRGKYESTEEVIGLADTIIDEINEALEESDFYKEWCKEHKGVKCYVGYWEGGIGFLMDADA